jgi:glucosylglycerate phosphorylase
MNQQIRQHILSIYGDGAAPEILSSIDALLTRDRPALPEVTGRRLTQSDVLLITYADQVTEPNVAPLLSLGEFCEKQLREAISGIHILPFYPWSSDDGFSVKDYFSVSPELGSWEDVARLGGAFDLMFDAVLNHMSAQSDWFQRFLRDEPDFRDFFLAVKSEPDLSQVVRPRTLPLLTQFQTARGAEKVWTTFSSDQVDLNLRSPRALIAVLEVLLFYAAKGARFIRLDAIAYLWKEIGTSCIHLRETHQLIQLMRSVLDQAAPHVLLITETNVPHQDNISYFGDGTNEAQLVYNFALPPLVLHSLASGNAKKLSDWAATLRLPSDQTAFFNFLASHDGIGVNPARGILSDQEIAALVARVIEHGGLVSYKHNHDGTQSPYELNITYFDALSNPASSEPADLQISRFMVAEAVMLALAGVPGIYFHSLFGSRNDRAAAECSGIPRRINRQKFQRTVLETELQSKTSLRALVLNRHRDLLTARRKHSAFSPSGPQKVLAVDERVFAILRSAPDGSEEVLCLHNVSDAPVTLPFPRQVPAVESWTRLFPPPAPGELQVLHKPAQVELSPYEICWLKATPS